MRCEQARQLFDAYLDGELPPALATELGAHRVRCPECRRALALLEVSGHIVASDRDPITIREGFGDRLLACMETPAVRWTRRVRRAMYVAGPLAAAAVIGLAFIGVFDRHDSKVAGEKVEVDAPPEVIESEQRGVGEAVRQPGAEATSVDERALEEWTEQMRENVRAKIESGESLHDYFDLTVLQMLDILDSRKDGSAGEEHFPGADIRPQPAPDETVPTDEDEVEDL